MIEHHRRKFNKTDSGPTEDTPVLVNDFETSALLLEENASSTTELNRLNATIYCREFVQCSTQCILDEVNAALNTNHPNEEIYRRLRVESSIYRKKLKHSGWDDYEPKAVATYRKQPRKYPIHNRLCTKLEMHGIVPQHWQNIRRVVRARNEYAHQEIDDVSPERVIKAYIHTHSLLPQDARALEAISKWLVKNAIGNSD